MPISGPIASRPKAIRSCAQRSGSAKASACNQHCGIVVAGPSLPSSEPATVGGPRHGERPALDRLKIGVIGCGAIAQIQHLPNLGELDYRFQIAGICDVSSNLLQRVGDDYHVADSTRFTDYHELLGSDIDGVIICSSGNHAPATVAAIEAGKHVLVEKPACITADEARAMSNAAEQSGVVLMVAYVKRHEPAYIFARERIARMSGVSFVQVNHLHTENELHTAEFKFHRPSDIPPEQSKADRAEADSQVDDALGLQTTTPEHRSAFNLINGSLIHDIGNLHGLFGPPERVMHTEIWLRGKAVSTMLEYKNGIRALMNWIDLPELWDFEETLAVYGSRERVIVSFPTGFSRGLPTDVTVMEIDGDLNPSKRHLQWHENAFKNELVHFGDCMTNGLEPTTPGHEVIDDVALVREIVRAWPGTGPN
ncbi:MAG: Gfo/Idh/MocA family oxidoreductase [Gammaproteobacteria bacterium]|nr:Gfo/Idh/MocA family oxidoreductase [Gammaproteobacteria bacterium]